MYILFTYIKTLYSLSQFFAYLCVGRSVNTGVCWAHNVLYQMGAQRGVAWGLSPVSEMLIMNINKSYTYTHTHIWLQHLSVLLSRFFNAPLYHMNSWRSQALQFPLVSTGFSGSVFYTTLHEKSISVIWYPRSSHFPFAPDCTSPSESPLLRLRRFSDTESAFSCFSPSEWGCWAKNETNGSGVLSWAYFN